jgi:hypothetical protein
MLGLWEYTVGIQIQEMDEIWIKDRPRNYLII